MKTSFTPEASAPGARCLTPQQQLWEVINPSKQKIFQEVFRRLKKRYQEDLCYAMVAYIRFGIKRNFSSPFLQILYLTFVDMVDGKLTNQMLNNENS